MIGVAQPVIDCAYANSRCALSAIVDGSAGFVVVPIRLLKLRSKKIVAAPFARICAGITVPDATAAMMPGFAGMTELLPAKSTHSGDVLGIPHESACAPRATAPGTASSRTSTMASDLTLRPG